jgi:hypothetical protein
MEAIKFSNKGQEWVVTDLIVHTNSIITSLGWTHMAGVKRPKGTKVYYANLVIDNGKVVNSLVVM